MADQRFQNGLLILQGGYNRETPQSICARTPCYIVNVEVCQRGCAGFAIAKENGIMHQRTMEVAAKAEPSSDLHRFPQVLHVARRQRRPVQHVGPDRSVVRSDCSRRHLAIRP